MMKTLKFFVRNIWENYIPQDKLNISQNKGFVHYREKGEISDKTALELLHHPEYEKYLTLMKNILIFGNGLVSEDLNLAHRVDNTDEFDLVIRMNECKILPFFTTE